MLFGGDIASLVIGDVEDVWDTCVLVEYPFSRRICRDRDVPGSNGDRRPPRRGLEGQLLIRVTQLAL